MLARKKLLPVTPNLKICQQVKFQTRTNLRDFTKQRLIFYMHSTAFKSKKLFAETKKG
jgi:hypothetical protein